eukprot:487179-Prymnesium_polylepis.1
MHDMYMRTRQVSLALHMTRFRWAHLGQFDTMVRIGVELPAELVDAALQWCVIRDFVGAARQPCNEAEHPTIESLDHGLCLSCRLRQFLERALFLAAHQVPMVPEVTHP